MSISPLRDRVVVRPLKKDATSPGGIVIPDTAKEKPVEGEIMAIGSGKLLDNGQIIPLAVKVGDKVLYGKYAGTEFKINSEEWVVMREDDILGIIKS